MCNTTRHNLSHSRWLLGAALAATLTLALLAGCKGNPTSAAVPENSVSPPPTVTVYEASADLKSNEILTNPAWLNTKWHAFSSPSNTTNTTAPTRAAVLFDATTLYVAFISHHQQPRTRDDHAGGGDSSTRDSVSLFLDTEGKDKNMIQIAVDSTGKASATWIRSSTPAQPMEDGTPNFGHPVMYNPDTKIPDLFTRVSEGLDGTIPVWTALLAIPLRNLPLPLSTQPIPGNHWKFNLTRTVVTLRGNRRVEELQSNLSPFHINAQPLSPYRLATLVLAGADESPQTASGNK